MISAKIITDSISQTGVRITTFEVAMPKFLAAEFNTHRVFSRNASSSRAIPFATMLEQVKTNPFIPIKFQKDHKGMQGTEYFEGKEHEDCVRDWLAARDAAVKAATGFAYQVTKQLRNRLLEPFLWHKAIVTSTDYENFFALRIHGDAEIHIADLAKKMWLAREESIPTLLNIGEWHLPYIELFDRPDGKSGIAYGIFEEGGAEKYLSLEDAKKVSVSLCAQVSYRKSDFSLEKALRIYKSLIESTPAHASPIEQQATPHEDPNHHSGNFTGWIQNRQLIKNNVCKKYKPVLAGKR